MPAYAGSFEYLDRDGRVMDEGVCHVRVEGGTCTVQPSAGAPMVFDLGDVDRALAGEWDLRLTLYTARTVVLRRFGPVFGRMSQELLAAWRDRTVECLLLEDLEEKGRFQGVASFCGAAAPSEVRVYGSNLAVLPVDGQPLQLRLAEVDDISFDEREYAVNIHYGGERLAISKLGRKTDEFRSILREAYGALQAQAAGALRDLFPFLDADALRSLVATMPEGRSVTLPALAAIHADLPAALIEHAVDASMKPYFDALRSRAAGAPLMAGFKFTRGEEEPPEPDEDAAEAVEAVEAPEDKLPLFFWFFFPLGKVAAWEAAGGLGRATYLFRLSDDGFEPDVAALTRGLASVNFRREPVYVSDDALKTQPRLRRYAIGSRRLPELKRLRAAMAGRAIHSSIEGWTAQLQRLG